VCGNAAVEGGEECDDGPGQVPPLGGDGCDATCQLEPNTYLEAEPNDDGVVAVLEDDFAIMAARALPSADVVQVLGSINPAGDEDYFLVTNTNMLPTGYRVGLVNGTCAAGSQLLDIQIRLPDGTILLVVPGDTVTCPTGGFTLLPGEALVLGVVVRGDDDIYARYQLAVEQVSLCGDAQTEGDEQCDPPDGMTCSTFCTRLCGDGTVGPGETCDDGPGQDPPASGDGCSATCQVELPPGIPETERNDDGTPEVGMLGFVGNDFLASAANGPYSATTLINAAFAPAGDEDVFAVTNPGAASITFSAETFVSTAGNCPMGTDTGINLRDAAGTRLAFDDDNGEGNCSRLEFALAPGQTLFVHVVEFGDDDALPAYQLLLRQVGTCGNARLEPGETCDDGGTNAMDGCSPACAVEQNYTCTTPPGGASVCVVSCGNGALEPPEQCDDGLLVPGDGCDASCLVEPGYTCNGSGPGGCVFSCGDGLVSGNETCDDGPLQVPPVSLDGCSATCQLEIPTAVTETERNDDGTPNTGGGSFDGNDFLATAANGPFSATTRIDAAISPVGDEDVFAFTNTSPASVVLEAETFVGTLGTCPGAPGAVDTVINIRDAAGTLVVRDDEGGVNSCSKVRFNVAPGQTLYIHVMEYGDNTTISSYSLLVRRVSACGDTVTGPGEACDDGGNVAGDGCSPACQAEPNYTCTVNGGISTCVLSCGNNTIEPQAGESCDDGALLPGDGCDASCHEEPGFTCRGPGFGGCSFTCGSSSISGNEQCDDGNFTLNDGCSDTCQVDPGYACSNPPVGPSVCQMAPAHAQCSGALAVGASLANQDTTFSGTLLSNPSCNGGFQDQPVLFYSVLVPPRSLAVVQVNVANGEPAFVYQLDGCATQACTAVTPLGGPGSGTVERVNPNATPETFLFAVGGDFARIQFGITTGVAPLDAGGACAMPLPVVVGNNGPFAAGGGVDDLSSRCLPGVVGGVTYHALTVPAESLVRLTVLPGSNWDVAARLLADCAAGSCLAQAAGAPPGLPDVITYSNATLAAQDLVLAVGSTTAGGGGSYSVLFERFDLGAYTTSSIPGACLSLTAPVTLPTTSQDDGFTTLQPLGFPFSYFGGAVTQYSVTTNGFMQVYPVGGGVADNDYNNPTLLPDINPPNGVIAPFWDDLLQRAPGMSSIRVETQGTAPNRVLVVEWTNWRFYSATLESSVLTFQAHLLETSNAVEFHYCTMTADPDDQLGQISGGSATVGMEDLGATQGVTWSANTAGSIAPASGVRFLP